MIGTLRLCVDARIQVFSLWESTLCTLGALHPRAGINGISAMESPGFRQGEEISLLGLGITIERREILDVFDGQIVGFPHFYGLLSLQFRPVPFFMLKHLSHSPFIEELSLKGMITYWRAFPHLTE